MRLVARLARLLTVAATCAACAAATRSGPPPIGADGVGLCPGSLPDSQQVADVAINDTSAWGQWVVQPLGAGRAPSYPPGARMGDVEADVVGSLIVDTAGRVVPRSTAIDRARVWRKGPQSAADTAPSAHSFAIAVCDFLSRQRYAPIHAKPGGPPVRARLSLPISFRTASGPP